MDSDFHNEFVQFIAIYCGRDTYDNDDEWIENMDACMEKLCDLFGHDFQPQA